MSIADIKTITSDEMRALEQAAIQSGQVTGLELMERAGQGGVEAIFEEWSEVMRGSQRAAVLCGPGNNGGDGFAIARLLNEAELDVCVFFYGSVDRLPPDARVNHDIWIAHGRRVLSYRSEALAHEILRDGTILVIDALLGIGQTRDCDAILAPILNVLDQASNLSLPTVLYTLSVDVPTGYDADTGDLLSTNPFEPDLTVTFHRKKPVHEVITSHGYQVVVKDIGL